MTDMAITVVCKNRRCSSCDKIRTVRLEQVAIGVLARPALLCAGCLMEMMSQDSEGSTHA